MELAEKENFIKSYINKNNFVYLTTNNINGNSVEYYIKGDIILCYYFYDARSHPLEETNYLATIALVHYETGHRLSVLNNCDITEVSVECKVFESFNRELLKIEQAKLESFYDRTGD